MSDNILQRIEKLTKNEGITVTALERKIGASKGVLSRAIAKGSDIQLKWVQLIVENYPQYSTEWLLTGNGEMLRQDSGTRPDEPAAPIIKEAIPLIPMDAFAGYPPQQYSDLPIEDYYQVAEFARADFLIRVKGDSMTPKFNGGDIVACKKIHERLFFQWHRIYVICTNSQGVMIKRVEHSDRQGCIRLVSDNPAYQPFDIPESDISDIALVMGAITLE